MLRFILIVIEFVIWGILTLPVVGILFLIKTADERKAGHIAQAMMRTEARIILWLTGSEIRVEGVEKIPVNQASVFIGNHTGIFDIVVAYAYLPVDTGFIAKHQLRFVPIINWFLNLTNGFFLNRENIRQGMKTILSAIEKIRHGISMYIFPEGTRLKKGRHWDLLPFHAGSFKLALKSGAPIVPIAITGAREVFEDHKPFIKPAKLVCIFGDPIRTEELDEDEKKHLADHVREILCGIIRKDELTENAEIEGLQDAVQK